MALMMKNNRMQAVVALAVVMAAAALAPCIPYATGKASALPSSCCGGVRSLNSAARTSAEQAGGVPVPQEPGQHRQVGEHGHRRHHPRQVRRLRPIPHQHVHRLQQVRRIYTSCLQITDLVYVHDSCLDLFSSLIWRMHAGSTKLMVCTYQLIDDEKLW